MKLKLALQDEVMSKGEALLCLVRGAASRSVRLTLWPLEIANKNALLIIVFFCMEVVFFVLFWSENGFTIFPRSLGSSKVLFD